MSSYYPYYLEKLAQYIKINPEIKLDQHSVSIPKNLKVEFYNLFRQAREELLRDKYSRFLEDARLLSKNYIEIEKKISHEHYSSDDRKIILRKRMANTKPSSLLTRIIPIFKFRNFKADCIIVDPYSDEFLHAPVAALGRVIFEPLFDLLQGKTNVDEFERVIDEKLNFEFKKLYQLCYGKWIVLNLLKIAKINHLYNVESDVIEAKVLVKQQFDINANKCNIPFPVKTKIIDLDYSYKQRALSTVDLLSYSNTKRQYMGIKTTYEAAAYNATNTPGHRSSSSFETVRNVLTKNPLLIYLGDNAADVTLTSDKKRFWHPDLALDIHDTSLESTPSTLVHDALKPSIGTFIIPCPCSTQKPTDYFNNSFSVLNIGFDSSKIHLIFDEITHISV